MKFDLALLKSNLAFWEKNRAAAQNKVKRSWRSGKTLVKEANIKAILEKQTQKWMTENVLKLMEKRKQVKVNRDNPKHRSAEISKRTAA